MKLLFNPSLSGFAYTNLKAAPGNMLFDCQTIGLTGLLELLQMYSGVNVKVEKPIERLLKYYKLLKEYFAQNPANILARSFDVDGLNTAKQCLAWRDNLCYAGWTAECSSSTDRLKALSAVERDFNLPGQPDLLLSVSEAIKNGAAIPQDLEIQVPCEKSLMMPAVCDLLKVLENRGAKISQMPFATQVEGSDLQNAVKVLSGDKGVKIFANDGSLQVLNFESQDEALSYLTGLDASSFDVWINSDNKLMDNWQKAQGKPTSGSKISGTIPEISQLFVMWVGLFTRPLNIKNLYTWLDSKYCPLPYELRNGESGVHKGLKSSIIYQGGFYNSECKEILSHFKEKDYKGYLPSDSQTLNVSEIRESAERFAGYCKQLAGNPNSSFSEKEKKCLFAVADQVSSLKLLLDSMQDSDIIKGFDGWVRTIYSSSDVQQYAAEVGCHTVIEDPANYMSNADTCIWCDFYNDPGTTFTYDFLTANERKTLESVLALWTAEKETEYRNSILRLPFLHTAKKLVLVNVGRVGAEKANKHPLLIQVQAQLKNLEMSSVELAHLNKDEIRSVDNRAEDCSVEITFNHKNALKVKESESPSSLESLVQYPLDYLFHYILGLSRIGIENISEFVAARGTLAHEVSQELLQRESYTRDEFNKVFDQKLQEHAAVLLLGENRGKISGIKHCVYKFVRWLASILQQNHLTFVEKERVVDLQNIFGTVGVNGRIDLLLKDAEGGYHVFDIKYSKGEFKESIEKNVSLQLAVYKELLEREGFKIKGCAYVIVKECVLFSSFSYAGDSVDVIVPKNTDDLFPKIEKSYKFRREQLESGIVENADGTPSNEIPYAQQQDAAGLFPLAVKGVKPPKKKTNDYSDYNLFARKKA